MAVTEKEAYQILRKPYVRTKEVAALLEYSSNTTSKLMTEYKVRKIHKGVYLTADFIKKFGLESYWKQIKRFANEKPDGSGQAGIESIG